MNKPLIIALIFSMLAHIAVFATVLIAQSAPVSHSTAENNNIIAISVVGKKYGGHSEDISPVPKEITHTPPTKPKKTTPSPSPKEANNMDNEKNQYSSVGENIITPPVELYFPKPKYPVMAKKRNLQGSVRLSISIDESGNVITMEVVESSRYKILDDAALSVKDRLRYIPATKDGKPIAFILTKTVTFALERQ